MVRVEIPQTVEELSALVDDINRTEAQQNARKWARAASVYRFTEKGHAGRPTKESVKSFTDSRVFTITEFAALKLEGLGSKPTVIAMRKAWESVCEDHGIAPEIGTSVDIDADWSDYYGRSATKGRNAKRAEEAAAYRQFPSTTQETTEEPHWEPNPDGSADRHVTEGVTIHKPSAAEMQAKRESPAMAGAYQRSDITNVAAMIDSAASYLRRALDKADDAGIEISNLDVIEDYLMTARNHNSKINNTQTQTRPGLRVV